MRNRVRRTDKFIFLFSLFYVFLFLGVNTLTNGLDFLFTIPFNFLGVYVSYLLVLKQLDVKNKLADKICVAFLIKNRHKTQRKAKFYLNNWRSVFYMQGGLKQTLA